MRILAIESSTTSAKAMLYDSKDGVVGMLSEPYSEGIEQGATGAQDPEAVFGKTAEVAVTDKETGAVWTSNPLGREEDPVAGNGRYKMQLNSQLLGQTVCVIALKLRLELRFDKVRSNVRAAFHRGIQQIRRVRAARKGERSFFVFIEKFVNIHISQGGLSCWQDSLPRIRYLCLLPTCRLRRN